MVKVIGLLLSTAWRETWGRYGHCSIRWECGLWTNGERKEPPVLYMCVCVYGIYSNLYFVSCRIYGISRYICLAL